MPALLAPGLWSLVASAGLTLSYQAGVGVEARAQQARPAVGENSTTNSLEIEPSLGTAGSSGALRLELAYAPRFTHLGGDGPDSDSWLHRAGAVVRWQPAATWQLRANGTATVGTVDLFRIATAPGQPGEPPPVGQAAPVATTLDHRRYELVVSAEGRLGRAFDLRTSLDVTREGGANATAREVLPLQQSAQLRAELAWRMSGRTTLAGVMAASGFHYFDVPVTPAAPGDPSHRSWSIWMGRAEAVWRRALTSHSRVWAGAGVTVVDGDAPGSGRAELKPTGEAGLGLESGPGWPRLSGGVMAAVAPVEDRLTGTVAQRAEARVWSAWSPAEHWSLGASALGARVMDGPFERQAFTAGEISLTRAFRDVLSVTAGGRWTTQWPPHVTGMTGLPDSQWVAYFSIHATHRSHERPAAVGSGGR
jgi:hypothetical protein